jgi:hypothetical protein
MGSAGSSLAASARDFALAEKTRPAGCPKDPLVFKPSNASPRLAGVVPKYSSRISSRETVQAGWLSYVYTGVPRQIFDLKRAGFLRQNRHLPHKSFQFESFKAKLFLTRPILSLQRSP